MLILDVQDRIPALRDKFVYNFGNSKTGCVWRVNRLLLH